MAMLTETVSCRFVETYSRLPQMPPDDQECVIGAVKTKADGTNDPEKANFEWVPSADPVAE